MKEFLSMETDVCYLCGSPNISKTISKDYFGLSLGKRELMSENLLHDDIYCFCCGDYVDSVDGLLVFYNNRLYTVSKVYKDYRVVEIMYKRKDDALHFECEVQKVAEIPALDVEYDPYIDTEKFIKEIFSRTGRQ